MGYEGKPDNLNVVTPKTQCSYGSLLSFPIFYSKIIDEIKINPL